MYSQNFHFLSFVALIVTSVATPMPANNDTLQHKKYVRDTGTSHSALSYIFGAAGCIVLLGIIFFAYCKGRRGEPVFGKQKKRVFKTARTADVEMARTSAPNAPAPSVREMHTVTMPAPVARPS